MPRIWMLLIAAAFPRLLLAQATTEPTPPRRAPALVQMIDQGAADPALKGIQAPEGIRVEVATAEPLDQPPQAIAFQDDGKLLVLEANQPGYSSGRLLRLSGGGGKLDEAEMLMNNLDRPAGLAAAGGWIYWTSRGRVLRRRPLEAEPLKAAQEAAAAKKGPPAKRTADRRWLEQELLRGLAAQSPREASKLFLSADGWLYVSCGSGDQRAESWDGSRASVLRSGAILRMRPDGSNVQEFARGLLQPGQMAIDPLGHVFLADADWTAAGPGGLRLIHALAGGDYGWQHAAPAKGHKDAAAARGVGMPDALSAAAERGIPDAQRAAAGGERSGTLPPLLRSAEGVSGDLLWWDSASFPEFCQGNLLAVSRDDHRVRFYALTREAASFRADGLFDLLRGGEEFWPAAIATGPDGGLYVAEQTAGKWRILRLSWSGTKDAPAIALGPPDAWQKLEQATDEELAARLESARGEERTRVIAQIAKRGKGEMVHALIADTTKSPDTRAAALAAAMQMSTPASREALATLLADENADLARLAADALGDQLPDKPEDLADGGELIKGALSAATDPLLIRSLQLTLAKLAAAAKSLELAEWGFESASVTHGPMMPRVVFDGHVRALELVPGAAKELMLGNIDVALNLPEADPLERQRIKEFVTLTAEAMRTRELAEFLDALLKSEPNLFVRLEAPLEARLLACYRNVVSDPPTNADAVADWLDKNPGGPVEVELAALETLSLVGTTKAGYVDKLAERLLAKPADAVLVARSYLAGKLDRGLLPQIKTALGKHTQQDAAGEAAALLKQLDTVKLPGPADRDRD